MSIKVSFRKTFFRLLTAITVVLCFSPSLVLAVDISSDTTISSDVTTQQKIQTNDDVTLTIDAEINFKLTQEDFNAVKNMSSALGKNDLALISDGVTTNLSVLDRKDPTTNNFEVGYFSLTFWYAIIAFLTLYILYFGI